MYIHSIRYERSCITIQRHHQKYPASSCMYILHTNVFVVFVAMHRVYQYPIHRLVWPHEINHTMTSSACMVAKNCVNLLDYPDGNMTIL